MGHFLEHEFDETVAAATWFHGIFANSTPMPQVSVIPANVRPAPMNADSPSQ
jgi:hypothetical protein